MANLSQKFIDMVNKEIGDGSANIFSERPPERAISTGSLGIDYLIGPYCPGFPLGKLSQVYGTEQSGKSLLCCQAAAEAQKMGLPVFLVDREKHYTPDWFARFGGNKEEVFDLHPQTIENCFGMVELAAEYITDNNFEGGLFIIDSLQSLPTSTMYEDDTGTGEGLAAVARFLSSRLGRYIDKIWEPKLALIVVGQLRKSPNPYASERDYTPGGEALKHYSVLRLHMRHSKVLTEKKDGYENRVGFETKVQTKKNDVGGRAPFKETTIKFYDGTGTIDDDALFQIARETGLISTSGAGWYEAEDFGKFRGEKGWVEFLQENPDLHSKIFERAFDPEIVLKYETARVSEGRIQLDEDEENPVFSEPEETD